MKLFIKVKINKETVSRYPTALYLMNKRFMIKSFICLVRLKWIKLMMTKAINKKKKLLISYVFEPYPPFIYLKKLFL
jgi:hypothetical protein